VFPIQVWSTLVAGDRWTGPHGPAGRGLLWWSSGLVDRGSGRTEGQRPGGDPVGLWSMGLAGLRGTGLAEIMQACWKQAWWGWGARPQQRSYAPFECGPGKPEGCMPIRDRVGLWTACLVGEEFGPGRNHASLWIASLAGLRGGGPTEIMCVCGAWTWQGWGLGSGGLEIPWHTEQQLHRPIGRAWQAAPAVLLVNPGMEKPSTSYGFRVLKFQLSLVLYLRQAFSRVSAKSLIHGARAVCSCIPVAILDPLNHFFRVEIICYVS
jgi:hypothetical protein